MLADARASSSTDRPYSYGLDQGGKESLCGDEKMDTEAPPPLCHQCAGCDQELPEGIREFTYCSPSCRDKYLLGSNFDTTKNEIRQLEQLLSWSYGGLEFMYTEACEKSPCSTCTALHKTVAAAGKDSSSSSRTSKHSNSTTGSTRSTNTFKGNTTASKNDSSSSSHTSKHSHLTTGSTRSADTFKGNTAASKNDSCSSSHNSKHSYSTAVKRKKQNEIKVKISKYGRERVGLLFSELPDAATHGFIITGFEIHSPAFKFFKNDQLHLLDIVLRVNDVEYRDPGCFDDKVADSLSVNLHCSRSIGLPAMSRILAESLSLLQPSTHVFVLRCTLPTVKTGIDFSLYEYEFWGFVVFGDEATAERAARGANGWCVLGGAIRARGPAEQGSRGHAGTYRGNIGYVPTKENDRRQYQDCSHYVTGVCTDSYDCPYRHKPVAHSSHLMVCESWLSNSCTDKNCPNRHPGPNVPDDIIRLASSTEYSQISAQFQGAWAHAKGEAPEVKAVFVIINEALERRWNAYKRTIPSFYVEKDHYHGTKLCCNLTVNNDLCMASDCSICQI